MSMSALLSALHGAGRQRLSASTVVLPMPATVSFLLRIEGYKNVQETFGNGTSINSSGFHAGGHDWRIVCYPNGLLSEHMGFISLFLRHASHERTGDASAKFQMSVLDSAGKPWHTKIVGPKCFSRDTCLGWGEREFLKIKQLKKGLNNDDFLNLLFDVTVLKVRTDDIDHAQAAAATAQAMPASTGAPSIAADVTPLLDMRNDLLEKRETVDVEIEAETPIKQQQEPAVKTSICEEILCRHIDMSSVGRILAFAEQHSCCLLTEACVQFLSRPGNLKQFMTTHGLETGCPSALKELILKLLP